MSRLIIGAVVLVFILLVGLVWVLGSRAKRRLAAQYPPPGQMVDVGGYRMHINCQGDRAEDRTVVMDMKMDRAYLQEHNRKSLVKADALAGLGVPIVRFPY